MSTQQLQVSIRKLITLERVQKLDLLIHLISNLSQSLVVCGPEGIGKTTLLQALVENKKDSWIICQLQGSSRLSFEGIVDQFFQQVIEQLPEKSEQNLSSILENQDKQNLKVVLIIDDAGVLVPGLIATLIEYAQSHNCLRLVLSLTADELHIKNSSDSFIDECHLIEIPPLSESQCFNFLQNLSARSDAPISFNAVTEGLVENLYRQTHGIPGRIVDELPRLSQYQSSGGIKWVVTIVVVAAVISAVSLFYVNKPETPVSKLQTVVAVTKNIPVAVKISSPLIQLEKQQQQKNIIVSKKPKKKSAKNSIRFENTVKNSLKENKPTTDNIKEVFLANHPLLAKDNEIILTGNDSTLVEKKPVQTNTSTQMINESIQLVKPRIQTPTLHNLKIKENVKRKTAKIGNKINKQADNVLLEEKKSASSESVSLSSSVSVDDSDWVKNQLATNYTIQLMVLSKRKAVDKLLKKYHLYRRQLKFVQLKKQPQTQYVVIYGSFKNQKAAIKSKQTLPSAFHNGWIRKFIVLQKKI